MGILRDLTGPIPSRDAPPFRFGLKPRHDALGRIRDRAAHRASVGTLERIIAKHVDPIRAELGLAPLHRLEEFYLAASLVLAYTAEPVRRPAQRLAHESPPGRTRAVEPPADTPSWLADLRQPLVLVTLLWAIDSTLPGMDAVRVSGTVVLVLGFAASASAVVPTFFALLHGNKAYLAVTSLLGLGALIAGLVMLIAASEAGFAVLTAVLLVLWAVTDGSSCPSREEHADNRRHRPGTRGTPSRIVSSVSEFATGRAHKARRAEDAKVVGEQVAGDRPLLLDVAHAALAVGENPHDRQPDRISEGSEPVGRLNAGHARNS